MKRHAIFPCLLALASMFILACAPPAAPTPTSPPVSKPTAAPPPAAPTTAPSPKPEAKAPATLRVAYPSQADFEDVPSLIAAERLSARGYKVETTFFAQPELAIEAITRGSADIGNGSARTYLKAIQKGAPIKVIAEQAGNSWSILAVRSIRACADLDGKRLAIHSEGAVSTAMLRAYLQKQCPQAKPNMVIIPGSENRAAALLAGQIDATPAELADVVQVLAKRPDDFHVMANFAKDVPELKATLLYASTRIIAEAPTAVQDYVETVVQVHRDINRNPKLLEEAAPKYLSIPKELLPDVVKAHMAANAFDPNGGLSSAAMEFSIKFFTETGDLDPGLTVSQATDLSFLEKSLAKLGPFRP